MPEQPEMFQKTQKAHNKLVKKKPLFSWGWKKKHLGLEKSQFKVLNSDLLDYWFTFVEPWDIFRLSVLSKEWRTYLQKVQLPKQFSKSFQFLSLKSVEYSPAPLKPQQNKLYVSEQKGAIAYSIKLPNGNLKDTTSDAILEEKTASLLSSSEAVPNSEAGEGINAEELAKNKRRAELILQLEKEKITKGLLKGIPESSHTTLYHILFILRQIPDPYLRKEGTEFEALNSLLANRWYLKYLCKQNPELASCFVHDAWFRKHLSYIERHSPSITRMVMHDLWYYKLPIGVLSLSTGILLGAAFAGGGVGLSLMMAAAFPPLLMVGVYIIVPILMVIAAIVLFTFLRVSRNVSKNLPRSTVKCVADSFDKMQKLQKEASPDAVFAQEKLKLHTLLENKKIQLEETKKGLARLAHTLFYSQEKTQEKINGIVLALSNLEDVSNLNNLIIFKENLLSEDWLVQNRSMGGGRSDTYKQLRAL